MRRLVSGVVLFTFILQPIAPHICFAQTPLPTPLGLPAPGTMLGISAPHTPVLMTGMTVHPENPLRFDFIVDTGDDRLQGEALRAETKKLINYFMASLTVPENEMWVNLSPHEKNRIIADGLSKTEMGRDMLAQDYILKQLAASLLYPEGKTGAEFWGKVRSQAQEKLGSTEIPTDLFNKVWIVPQEASVYVHGNNVFVTESHLKVMLEQDYRAASQAIASDGRGISIISPESAQIIREIILPEIEKEVNQGKNFSNLRQIYQSMILATWYKKKLKNSILDTAYLDKNKTGGIELDDQNVKEQIYDQYLAALKKGVYNYIKEDYDPITEENVPHKYFSGGLKGVDMAMLSEGRPSAEWLNRQSRRQHVAVNVDASLLGVEADFAAVGRDLPAGRQDRAMLGLGRPKKVVDVKRIIEAYGLPINRERNIRDIVEEPWREAVRVLFRKGLKTDYSSANAEDLPKGAKLGLVKISERNVSILRDLDGELQARGEGKIQFYQGGAMIYITFTQDTTVEQFSQQAVALVSRLEDQKAVELSVPVLPAGRQDRAMLTTDKPELVA